MIRALIFDFDGLILDTETPDVTAWQAVYAEHQLSFPVTRWGTIIGGSGRAHFDAGQHLEELLGRPLDLPALRARQNQISRALVGQQPILPGVLDTLRAARRLKLKLAIASSSPHAWVEGHLARLGLTEPFDAILCAEDVLPGRIKPQPDLFLAALQRLQVRAGEAVVFEDSPNGVEAARSAGIRVVAVPNPTTARLTIAGEDLRLTSLAELPLADLLARLGANP